MNRVELQKLTQSLADDDLIWLKATLDFEMRRRKIAFSVGEIGERLAIEHFLKTPGLPNLQAAQRGGKNVDALSRDGERYSIKTQCSAKKTGTIYPDSVDREKQLFEHLLIVKLNQDWTLQSIYQLSWRGFIQVRSWDSRMNAWYVAISARSLKASALIYNNQISISN